MTGSINLKLGKIGEEETCRYLLNKGHTILERNWRAGHQEIDIISIDKNGIHFVEVKSRRIPMEIQPQESVTKNKQRNICKCALRYLNQKNELLNGDTECHFDIAAVIFAKDSYHIEMFEDAFFPGI